MQLQPITETVNNKKQSLFLILSGIFITNALLAELIGVKIFSLEATFGISPVNLSFFTEDILNLNLTAGVLVWPVVFITTDIINEYFGKRGVKKVSFLTVVLICYAFIVIYLIRQLSPAGFWLDLNKTDNLGRPFNINYAFNTLFRQGLGIMLGSVSAFLLSQLLDILVFSWLRKKTGPKMIWLRATGSTLISQFVDSFVVLGIAFYVFGNWSLGLLLSVGLVNYLYKCVVAIALTPILYLVHYIIDSYLGTHLSERLQKTAATDIS